MHISDAEVQKSEENQETIQERPKTNQEIQLERNAESLNWFDSQQGWRESKKQNSRLIDSSLRKKEVDLRRQQRDYKIHEAEHDFDRIEREVQRKVEENQQRELRDIEQQRRDEEIRRNHR